MPFYLTDIKPRSAWESEKESLIGRRLIDEVELEPIGDEGLFCIRDPKRECIFHKITKENKDCYCIFGANITWEDY